MELKLYSLEQVALICLAGGWNDFHLQKLEIK